MIDRLKNANSMQRWRGFTLIELLVVIGIIAILIGFLLPSLHRARESAKTTQCAANLRTVGQALVIYVNENRGFFPGWSGWHVVGGNGTGDDEPGPGWTEVLNKDVNPLRSTVWNCPDFPAEFRINYFLAARYTFVSHRQNLRFSEVRLSTKYVLSGDCTTQRLYPPAFGTALETTDDCDKDDATQEAVLFSNESGGRNMHRGGNNVLFADSHVDLIPRFDPTLMTYHPRRMETWENVTPN